MNFIIMSTTSKRNKVVLFAVIFCLLVFSPSFSSATDQQRGKKRNRN
jgi:hypothetical protein